MTKFLQWMLFFGLCYYLAACGAERRAFPGATTPKTTTRTATASPAADMIAFARLQLGTPYRYAGKQPGGFDCSGYTCYVMQEFGVTLPGNSGMQEGSGRKVSAAEAQPGDLVFFRRMKGGRVFHVALITANADDGMHVIHSTSSRGVVEDNITTNSYWKGKVKSYRRVLGE